MISEKFSTTVCGYVLVGILWGCSNPFLKHGQQKAQAATAASVNAQNKTSAQKSSNNGTNLAQDESQTSFIYSLKQLFTSPRLFLPFAINQSGSIVYYYMLSSEPVSRASPICNALTFAFTAATAYTVFGEEIRYPFFLWIGVIFVILGISACLIE
jgi:glucose uptake protein GlcU